MRTRATIDGDMVTIDGSKIFNTHGPYADYYVVWARFSPEPQGIGAVIVPSDAPGFSRGATEHYLSGEPHCALYFDACRVPVANVLTDQGGLRRLLPIFNIERLGNAARSLACGERAFGAAVDHLKQRRQFGRPLADNQGLRWRMARLRVQLDAARLLLYRAASDATGLPSAADSSIAKYACNVAGFEAVNEAIQMFGAAGLSTQTDLPYLLGRTRGWMIAGGSVEMMQNAIAQSVLGRVSGPAAG
jgi:alkylation response protein AidB-like acyl-CoA dehydrogenase